MKKMLAVLFSLMLLVTFVNPALAGDALYGVDTYGSFFLLDTTTGATTPIANTGANGIEGLTFTPYGYFLGTSYNNSSSSKFYHIALDGTTTRLANVTMGEVQGLAMSAVTGVLYGAESSSCRCLVQIDPLTGSTIKIGNGFGSGASEIVGLAIDPTTNTMYGVNSVPSSTSVSTLYTIDMTTGVATYLSTINYPNITTLAIDREGNMYGVSGYYNTFVKLWTNGTFTVISTFPTKTLAIDFDPPVAAPSCSYAYSEWGGCSANNTQVRTVTSATPSNCSGTPVTTQSCVYVPPTCSYVTSGWSACQSNNTQTRTLISFFPADCVGIPVLTQSCVYVAPTCSYTYSAWGACQSNNTQSRTVISSAPLGCAGTPVTTQSCVYVPPVTTVTIDIKNSSGNNDNIIDNNPAPINIKAGGLTPVIIYTSGSFVANTTTIDVASIVMGGTKVTKSQNVAKGLKVWFDTSKFNFASTDTRATLTGKTKANVSFTGTDTIRIITSGCSK